MKGIWIGLAGVLLAGSGEARQLDAYVDTVPGTLVTFDMLPVPGGTVMIGGERHEVGPFWMSRTEVPWELYDVFALKLDVPRSERLRVDAESRPSNPYGAPDHGYGHRGYAAISITWQAADAFARWLTEKTGRVYRVPTDAEWTHAARLNHAPGFELNEVAWHAGNAEQRPHPVASKTAGALGHHDLLGNVLEWVSSSDGPVTRGGAWKDPSAEVHPDARERQQPSWNATDPQIPKSTWWLSDGKFVGFRIVRVP